MATSSPFRALAHYRLLPQLVGWPALIVALVARAPYAMLPLGILTAFTAATGNIAVGGLATATFSLSTAVASPLLGRAADLWGERRVLFTLIPLNSVAIGTLFLISLQASPGPYLWVVCALAGLTNVPFGSFTRARWVARVSSPYELAAAFSYESMADELVFVMGPALVGIAASAAAPSAPLALACVLMLTAGLSFASAAPRSAPKPKSHSAGAAAEGEPAARPAIGRVLQRVLPSILILIAVGGFFGSTQAGTTVLAEDLGAPDQAGLAYAVMGVGSALTSLLVVMIPERVSLPARIGVCAVGMALSLIPVSFQGSLPLVAVFLGLAGLWVGPTLVTAFTLTEKMAPPGGLSVALTAMASSVTIGVSLGSGVGGVLAERLGAGGAFAFAIASSLAILGVAAALFLSSRDPHFSGG